MRACLGVGGGPGEDVGAGVEGSPGGQVGGGEVQRVAVVVRGSDGKLQVLSFSDGPVADGVEFGRSIGSAGDGK